MADTVKLPLDKWFRREAETEGMDLQKEEIRQQVVNLSLDVIKPSPYQTRTDFDEAELRELAQSITEVGIIQPIIVRDTPEGYELVAGERRLRASRLCGLSEIPALIVEMANDKAAAVTLIENVQRTSLNYLEEAEAYQLLINEFGFKQEELARRLGKSQSTVANKLRLLKLPPEVKSHIRTDLITERHARALLQLNDPRLQTDVLKTVIERELTVKATEELVHKLVQPRAAEPDDGEKTPPDAGWSAARTYVNSIKEVVYKAKENGINMVYMENRKPEGYEIVIKLSTPAGAQPDKKQNKS